ncbi:alpha/beta fold hydrolase [Nocardia sp. NBC_01499]|uniref:alpha/beta fold hydrolase n=1 Tax=Nocardia sp. NBC_01499 TaxID=2903597 RepID=UPI0038667619
MNQLNASVLRAPTTVRPITLNANGITLSALLDEPVSTPPRATIVALHGAGMSAGYFHGQAHPDLSLFEIATRLGYTVLSVDRPGYRMSADRLPEGQSVAEQAETVLAGIRDFTGRYDIGDGFFLLGHSLGAKVALTIGAADPAGLLGVDVSGCGYRYVPMESVPGSRRRQWIRHWGSLQLYPLNTFRSSSALISSPPPRELGDVLGWTGRLAELAPRVRVPVRFTFAEFEGWWRHAEQDLAELRSLFAAAPRVSTERIPKAGHNISLGWAARTYHLQALAYFESCLLDGVAARNATYQTERTSS